MFSEHNGITLEINSRNIPVKSSNIFKLNTCIHNTLVKEVSREIKKYFELKKKKKMQFIKICRMKQPIVDGNL